MSNSLAFNVAIPFKEFSNIVVKFGRFKTCPGNSSLGNKEAGLFLTVKRNL